MSHDRRIRLGEESDGKYSEIICVIDRSGSMRSIRDDAIGGFNVFLDDQKKLPGEAFLTLVQFANDYEVVHEGMELGLVPDLTHETYKPDGGTALFDAICRTIESTQRLFDRLPANAHPDTVIFVVVTDGEENASKQYTRDDVRRMITDCRANDWEFIFTAANVDAFVEGGSMGFSPQSISSYQTTPEGIGATYSNLSRTVSSLRHGNPSEEGE